MGVHNIKTFIFSQISIDGKLTKFKGDSSKEFFSFFDDDDMRYIHSFRNKVDGIMVGKNTIDIDNPKLTNRFWGTHQPIRIIPTTKLDMSLNSNIFIDSIPTLIITIKKNKNHENVQKIRDKGKECLFFGEESIDFHELFKYLESERNICSIMIEGGGKLNWSLLSQNLIDEVIILQLPIIVGGVDNITLVDGIGFRDFTSCNLKLNDIKKKKHFTYMQYVVIKK